MRALVFDGEKLEIAEVPFPERGKGFYRDNRS